MYGIRKGVNMYVSNGTGRDMMIVRDPGYCMGRLGVGCLHHPDPYNGGPPPPKSCRTDGFNEYRTYDGVLTHPKVRNSHVERRKLQNSSSELQIAKVLHDSAKKEKTLVRSFSTGNITDDAFKKWSRSIGTVSDLNGPVHQPKTAPPTKASIKFAPNDESPSPKKQRPFPYPEDADRHPYYGFSREPYGGYWKVRSFIGPG